MASGAREWASPDDEVMGLFEAHGFSRVETAVLQPAEIFLDLSGEDIRRRLYLTQDSEGRELCLRPEHTIPVCRRHVASGAAAGEYCYMGPVFRLRGDQTGEFVQAGIESIGREEIAAADAECLGLALDGLRIFTARPVEIVIGDMGLLAALVDTLDLPPGARRRLLRALAAGRGPETALAPLEPSGERSEYAGLLAAIEGQDPRAARAFVEDVISIAGFTAVGGRSAGEIAERFLSRAENRSGAVPERARAILSRYFAVRGDPDEAARALRGLAREEGLDLGAALDRFEERTGFIAARGIDVARLRFAADFARNLDYYTGFIFEVRDPARSDAKSLVGGGRYDRLLQHLGLPAPVPAVGCSFWLDRMRSDAPVSDSGLILAIPSKGRLQENASAFFKRAGLTLSQARGARDYRASLVGLPDVEVMLLSAAEIVAQLASGGVHLGITGEDLLREQVADADLKLELVTGLGFGHANLVVAVPQAWIDVRSMADLDEVAADIRARHGRRMRVATKYLNLTRRFFADKGVADYRIVESPGATEAAPASGSADLIVDITTTGATLAANGLRVLDDGTILRSEANLVGSLAAPWSPRARSVARTILSRIAAEEEARTTREIRAGIDRAGADLPALAQLYGALPPFGREDARELVLHCPASRVFDVVQALTASGARDVTVRTLDYVFRTQNPLTDRLFSRLG